MGFALLERYIFKKALMATLVVVSALTAVVWIVRAVQQVDLILSKGQGIITYLQMISLGVPTLVAAVAPIALLIGLIQIINRLNEDSELVVMHASGASRLTLFKPFIAISLLTTIVVYFLALWAGPTAMASLRDYVTQVRADLISVIVREGKFQDVGKSLTFHVGERAPGGVLNSVFILDSRSKKETLTYIAKRGLVSKVNDNSYLVLQDGQIQRKARRSRNMSIIRFNSYAFNLSSFSGDHTAKISKPFEFSTTRLINPGKDDPFYNRDPGRFRAELHIRLTSGLYPLMVGLIVLVFLGTPSSHRQGHTLSVVAAVGTVAVLRGATIVAEGSLGANGALVFVVWGIPLTAILFSFYLLSTGKRPIPARLQTNIEKRLERAVDGLKSFRSRYLARSQPGGAI